MAVTLPFATMVGFANKSVLYSVDSTSAGLGVTVNQQGLVKVPSTVPNNTEITITGTSVFDSTKSNTSVITVA